MEHSNSHFEMSSASSRNIIATADIWAVKPQFDRPNHVFPVIPSLVLTDFARVRFNLVEFGRSFSDILGHSRRF
jgi:hypothetical protein